MIIGGDGVMENEPERRFISLTFPRIDFNQVED